MFIRLVTFCYLLSLLVTSVACSETAEAVAATNSKTPRKQPLVAGFSFEAPPNPIDTSVFAGMKRCGGNWVALIPYAFVPKGKAEIWFDDPRQWWGERSEGIIECTRLARTQHQHVLLKPQLWLDGGVFTGEHTMNDTATWKNFEFNYTRYILHYAKLADSLDIELFCIGTELASFVEARPAFWEQLIDTVRRVYHGRLTYAENWDSWQKVKFWHKLDYIGVDAYFPLSKSQTPDVTELLNSWKPYATELEAASLKHNKPILFTEFGYRSCDASAAQPWASSTNAKINMAAQENAYEALFRTFVPQPWFAGGFIWKWHADPNSGGKYDNDYTPQNKPVLKCIAKWYAQ